MHRHPLGRASGLSALAAACLLSACGGSATPAEQPPDAPGPAALFAQGKGDLSTAERVQIFEASGLALAPDGKGFIDGMCGQPAGATVEFRDMNADGHQEVLVISGNSCTSGSTGSSAVLYVRDRDGLLQANFGFPAAGVDPLPEKNEGYPDLLIGGPGFCFGVWRWNGVAYDYLRNDPQMPGGCDHLNE